jgi:hypothetical protein
LKPMWGFKISAIISESLFVCWYTVTETLNKNLFQSIACFLIDLTDQLQQWKLCFSAWPCILCCVFSLYTKFTDKFDATGHSSKTCSIRPVVKTADLLLGFLQAGLAKLIGLAGDTNVQVDLPYSHSLSHSQALWHCHFFFPKTASNLLPTITLSLVLLVIIWALH